jgi:uncharacterized protein (TIGR02246 family)
MRITLALLSLLFAAGTRLCSAQENARPAPPNANTAATSAANQPQQSSPDVVAIHASAESFVAAFNQHNAHAVAALWTKDGEYIDDTGRSFVGRTEIEKSYQEFFTANPDAKIQIMIDSVRLLTGDTAIEDGRAAVLSPAGDSAPLTNYTVVHAKVDGKWLMASVRDALTEVPVALTSAADLEWLIGTWSGEEHGIKTESICTWVFDGRFIERKYTTTQLDGTKSSGVQLIGWNPQGGHVQSWSFSPEGGHAVGIWTPQPEGWAAQMTGVTGDGMLTTAINQLRRLDDNAYVWQSVQRTAGGIAIPDTEEVILKRQPIAP